jgi:cell division protein FtsB
VRKLTLILGALLLLLQYPLWLGDGGVLALWKIRHEIAAQQAENQRLRERNQVLVAEVLDLKEGLEAVEERARAELGMVKKGETFFHVIEAR